MAIRLGASLSMLVAALPLMSARPPLSSIIVEPEIASVRETPAPGEATPNCTLSAGWAEVERRKPRYVVFGELHGTEESPAFVGNLACALAVKGERLLVAVEHNAEYDAAFQAAWRLPPAQFTAELQKAGWAGRNDGVASKAMLQMLVRLHALKQRGRSINIVAFNGARDDAQRARLSDLPGQGPHEAAQAENIRTAANARPYDRVLILVGNIHARKLPVDFRGVQFKPMVMQLAPAETIVALNMRTADGSSWGCRLKQGLTPEKGKPLPQGAITCGPYPMKEQLDLHQAPFVALGDFPQEKSDGNYDGFFWLGTVHASAPAVPAP